MILAVDDEPEYLGMIRTAWRAKGWEVRTVEDPRSPWRGFRSEPDLIFFRHPYANVMDGYAFELAYRERFPSPENAIYLPLHPFRPLSISSVAWMAGRTIFAGQTHPTPGVLMAKVRAVLPGKCARTLLSSAGIWASFPFTSRSFSSANCTGLRGRWISSVRASGRQSTSGPAPSSRKGAWPMWTDPWPGSTTWRRARSPSVPPPWIFRDNGVVASKAALCPYH